MALAVWIRSALTRAESWSAEVERLRTVLAAEPAGPERTERTLDLAEATEHIEPDRSRALALYLAAWRDGHLAARTSVLELASELRAYATLAEVAIADHADTRDPESLVAAGRAWIDAGLFERAVETFVRGGEQHESLVDAIASSPRLADVRTAIALAKFQKIDPEKEVDGCVARAQQAGAGAAPYFLQAVRIARVAQLARASAILNLAARSCPQDGELVRMFEDALLETGSSDDFLSYHRPRLDAVTDAALWAERVRAVACELVLRDIHPGLGLRMLRTSIEHAYRSRLAVRRHIAAWELLLANARDSSSTLALAPLLADGLRANLPTDDVLYVARTGAEICWRDVGDTVAAQPYIAALLDHFPGHPYAVVFLSVTLQAPPEPEPEPEPVSEPEPVVPAVTFKLPVMRRNVSAIPTTPPPPAAATARSPRKVVPVDVVVELPTGAFFSAVLRDLSTTGAFVSTKRVLDAGTLVTLEIRLPSARGLAEQHFRIDARIARRTELGCGLAFVDAPPALIAGITALIGDEFRPVDRTGECPWLVSPR